MNKKYLPFIVVALVILLGVAGMMVISNKNKKSPEKTYTQTPSSVVPTVDSSVKVTIEEGKEKGYIVLNIDGIPTDTDTIEYEFTYDTKEQGLQGSINDPVSVKGKKTFSKEVFLGTQSGKAKTYHEVVGPIRVALLFNGTYGSKSFEKEYEL